GLDEPSRHFEILRLFRDYLRRDLQYRPPLRQEIRYLRAGIEVALLRARTEAGVFELVVRRSRSGIGPQIDAGRIVAGDRRQQAFELKPVRRCHSLYLPPGTRMAKGATIQRIAHNTIALRYRDIDGGRTDATVIARTDSRSPPTCHPDRWR